MVWIMQFPLNAFPLLTSIIIFGSFGVSSRYSVNFRIRLRLAWGRGDWVPVSTGSNKELTSSVYFFVDATILAKAAKLFGKEDDYKHYSQLADDIKKAINNKFLDREKGIYASGSQQFG